MNFISNIIKKLSDKKYLVLYVALLLIFQAWSIYMVTSYIGTSYGTELYVQFYLFITIGSLIAITLGILLKKKFIKENNDNVIKTLLTIAAFLYFLALITVFRASKMVALFFKEIIDQIILIFTNTACVYNGSNVYRFVDLNDLYLYSFINVFNPLFFIIAFIYLIASSFINLLKKEDVKLYTETNKFIKQPKLDEKYFYSYKNLSFGLQYKPLP